MGRTKPSGQLVGKKKSGIRKVTRDDLITMVQRGEMTPVDAESQAKRLGLGPLASEPDPNDYDPMREPFWRADLLDARRVQGVEPELRT